MPVTVLVADRESAVRRALEALISGEEALELVGSAADLVTAVALARKHLPDVALVDVGAPGGHGAQVAREIHACSPGTRVVALSSYGERASAFDLVRAGAIGYLVESASIGDIVQTIVKATNGHGSFPPDLSAAIVHELTGVLAREQSDDEWRKKHARVSSVISDDGLTISFQPIVALEDGRYVGCEALARFPEASGRTTEEWFDDAAAVGLQTELELAAIEAALARLPALPSDTFMTVNVSPGALLSPRVLDALLASALERVVVEITEHARVDDYDALNAVLEELRRAGARIAIDDAGAGFASLRHVLHLSPDIIKIDRSLTADLESRAVRALVAALISFAAELGQTVVVEGVETAPTVRLLAELGVHWGQGYFLGRPGALPVQT